MAVCKLGTTIIDNLVICFIATPTLLSSFRNRVEPYIDNVFFSRAEGHFHRHYFNILSNDGRKLGNLYFDRYASDGNELYLWLKVENSVLYDRELLQMMKQIPDRLGLQYHGISSLDLARDFGYDIASRIRKMMRREDLAVIINGKEVRDRNKMLKGVFRTCEMSLAKDGTKGMTIKQAKAGKNKHLGITMDCYNKAEEIENSSGWEGKDISDLTAITRGAIVHVIGRLKCNRYVDANGNDRVQDEIVAHEVEVKEDRV